MSKKDLKYNLVYFLQNFAPRLESFYSQLSQLSHVFNPKRWHSWFKVNDS